MASKIAMPRDKKGNLPPILTPRLKTLKENPGLLFVGQVLGEYRTDTKGREQMRCRVFSLWKGELRLSERWVLCSDIPPMMLSAWNRGQNLQEALRFSGFVPDHSLEIFSEKEIAKSPVTSRLSSTGLMIQVGGGVTFTTEDGVQRCRVINCSWRWGVLVRFLYSKDQLRIIQPDYGQGATIPNTITKKVLVQSSEEHRIDINDFESVFYVHREDEWESWMETSADHFLVRHHIEWNRNENGKETSYTLQELLSPLPHERALAIIARGIIECNRFDLQLFHLRVNTTEFLKNFKKNCTVTNLVQHNIPLAMIFTALGRSFFSDEKDTYHFLQQDGLHIFAGSCDDFKGLFGKSVRITPLPSRQGYIRIEGEPEITLKHQPRAAGGTLLITFGSLALQDVGEHANPEDRDWRGEQDFGLPPEWTTSSNRRAHKRARRCLPQDFNPKSK